MMLTTRQKRLHIDESILSLSYNDVDLETTIGDKILGIDIDANLTWNDHFHVYLCTFNTTVIKRAIRYV